MPKLLVLVHGMGRYDAGWSTTVQDALQSSLAGYAGGAAAAAALFKGIVVQEICYDSVFRQYVDGWARDRDALGAWSKKTGVALPGVVAALAKGLPAGEESFLWDVALDPVLYRSLKLVRDDTVSLVLEQFTARWGALLDGDTGADPVEVVMLCHGQGAMVMSDALALLGSGQWSRNGGLGFTASEQTITLLVTLANLSQLAPSAFTPALMNSLDSCVRPRSAPPWAPGRQNYLKQLVTVQHASDPLVLWGAFHPPVAWGDRNVFTITVDHVHQANTHGFTHYLASPRVHVPLLRALFGSGVISPEAEEAARSGFPEILPPECNAVVHDLKAAVTKLGARPPGTLDDLATAALEFYRIATEAQRACTSLPFER